MIDFLLKNKRGLVITRIVVFIAMFLVTFNQMDISAAAKTPRSAIRLTSKAASLTLNEETSLLACFRMLRFSKTKAVKCFSINVAEIILVDFALCVMSTGDIDQCLPLLEKSKQ